MFEALATAFAAQSILPLPDYIALCNAHYYATRDPLGQTGDFTTAPEISQLFGELLGLWAVNEWERLGAPTRFTLLELGPGRGTLMRDALRAARVRPAFLDALRLQLCETSPVLRAMQADRLQDYWPEWRGGLTALPPLPTILIANEFFDALPTTQVMRIKSGWQQRCVTLRDGHLTWIWQPLAVTAVPADLHAIPEDTIVEYSSATRALMRQLCTQLARQGGSLAIVDYGDRVAPARLANGDTLQAIRRHRPVDPFDTPGEADLTCHVDFAPLSRCAQAAGLATGYGTQGEFLTMLGIEGRAAQLGLQEQAARLIDLAQMGNLFKVLTVSSR